MVRPISELIASVDCHLPTGSCSTNPRSVCTGPPKCIGIDIAFFGRYRYADLLEQLG